MRELIDEVQCDSNGYIRLELKGELIRCGECKHGITGHGITDGFVLCSKPYAMDTVGGAMHRCDWFCADGKRKDGAE
jgi:hypothetical protein